MQIVEILDEDDLYRRVPPLWMKGDGSITSGAFQNTRDTDDMSVDLGRLTTPEETALAMEGCCVVSFKAKSARRNEQDVFHDPEKDNYAHSTVRGKKTNRIRRELKKASIVILGP